MDDKEIIKNHYNQIPNKSELERRKTSSINIKRYNNKVKTNLFLKYILPGYSVLDFGVGKGGDLRKYQQCYVAEVFGIDISNRGLLDALERARESPPSYKLTLKIRDCFTNKIDLLKSLDVISMQFSFHYCCGKEEDLDCTLSNIIRHLNRNGVVLMTILCKDEILRRKANNKLSNSFYSLTFIDPEHTPMYGCSYYYQLKDCINNCVEYLVDIPNLTKKAEEVGLQLIQNRTFSEFLMFTQNLNKGKHCVPRLDDEETEVVSLHRVLVFKRVD